MPDSESESSESDPESAAARRCHSVLGGGPSPHGGQPEVNSFVDSRASLSGVSSGSAYRTGESSWDITGLNLVYYSPRARGWLYTFPFVTSACASRKAAPNGPSKDQARWLRPARPTQISSSCYAGTRQDGRGQCHARAAATGSELRP